MRIRDIFTLWLPLAVSFELMMLEGPAVQGAMGRLPEPGLNLAAWGLTMSISLLIESPVIMLLGTSIALVKDAQSYLALRRFTVWLCVLCTLLTGLVAFTPLFDFIAGTIMGQPEPIVERARPAMQVMLLWTGAIGWRRFLQGIIVREQQTRLVSWGTVIRLVLAVGTAVWLVRWGGWSGAVVGAAAIMAGVLAEAVATTLFARPLLRRSILSAPADALPLREREIWKFHTPLALTSLLILAAQPLTASGLARMPNPEQTLAAWPVVFMLLLVMRGWGMALQEITVAQIKRGTDRQVLYRFAWLVGGVTSLATLLIATTPLGRLYLRDLIELPPALMPYAQIGILGGALLPLLTTLSSWARGLLMGIGAPQAIYQGMVINLAIHALLLVVGVLLQLPGMLVAAGAFTAALVIEYLFLARRTMALNNPRSALVRP